MRWKRRRRRRRMRRRTMTTTSNLQGLSERMLIMNILEYMYFLVNNR